MKLIKIILMIGACHIGAFTENYGSPKEPERNSIKGTDSQDKKESRRWVFFPIIQCGDETSWVFGLFGLHMFPLKPHFSERSKIEFTTQMSLKKQFNLEVHPEVYFNRGNDKIYGDIRVNIWHSTVYPIGQDSPDISQGYDSKGFEIKGGYRRKIFDHVSLSGEYRVQRYDTEYNNAGILKEPGIVGRNGGLISGTGIKISFDTRDNRIWTTQGSYCSIQSFFNARILGSDFTYQSYELDYRTFIPLGKKGKESVIGMAFHARSARGNIPFFKLKNADGGSLLRGINGARYRDRDLLAVQVEYRSPLFEIGWFGPFGFTGFFEMGQVAHSFRELKNDHYIYSLGGGIRYSVVPDERLNLRIDFSYVDEGFGFVLGLCEAF